MSLSPRETQCLNLLSEGYNDANGGERIGIADRTFRFHIENAKRKLNAKTRTHAVALAIRSGELVLA